ncbi:PREDICTED: uncharacterized protein LOC109172716 [Ipomoea nil]|uniref:uncharacterized protein LOC109172716 n=1 Tax=Ipomoea nil TaxID=35883 RepID=UPI0009015B83|nr:PREDICTED: uncharacterized protein LOC109172716 [Ipomoea nil]
MGGCASRPKVLRDDIDAPIPLPPPVVVEEEVTKDVVVVEEAPAAAVEGASQFEDVDDVNDIPSVTDHLSTQDEEQSLEEVKEEIFETKQASEPSKSKPQEHETPIEEQEALDLIVLYASAEPEPEETETCMEKTIEEVKEVTEVTRMDDRTPEWKTEEDLDIAEDDVPKPEIEAEAEAEEGSEFGLDHSSEPENREEETATAPTTKGSKKAKKQYWQIGTLLSLGKAK